jgi:hypothetical protein
MRADIKQEWITRLRSGIPQVKRVLGKGDARCAIGVLCDIAVDLGITTRRIEKDGLVVYGGNYVDLVPPEVYDWSDVGQYYLATIGEMNDDGASFAVIAKFIDEHL